MAVARQHVQFQRPFPRKVHIAYIAAEFMQPLVIIELLLVQPVSVASDTIEFRERLLRERSMGLMDVSAQRSACAELSMKGRAGGAPKMSDRPLMREHAVLVEKDCIAADGHFGIILATGGCRRGRGGGGEGGGGVGGIVTWRDG